MMVSSILPEISFMKYAWNKNNLFFLVRHPMSKYEGEWWSYILGLFVPKRMGSVVHSNQITNQFIVQLSNDMTVWQYIHNMIKRIHYQLWQYKKNLQSNNPTSWVDLSQIFYWHDWLCSLLSPAKGYYCRKLGEQGFFWKCFYFILSSHLQKPSLVF
jgi:hypothetical protein